ncbi:pentatricopeptide repeat-containing protein DOT4, chloroplastic-like [Canna indica]|uniref:Pentatricopeptide repeat-containing protein DOT4, chloroplastic-like n=1 Tax=Canna indica TaxID=4628 RepID=A0AAQ3K8H4_9LILI|nr:pentatricopeptide repeat-containing protein DOT4, chloroplastic-like [Canna indica]
MLAIDTSAVAHFPAIPTLPSAHYEDVTPHLRGAAPRRCPRFCTAVSAFNETSDRANALIRRHARDGRPREALSLFRDAVAGGSHEPDHLLIATVLNCCASLGAIRSGRELHGYMVRRTGQKALTCSSGCSLVAFYAKRGFLSSAREVFDQMSDRDIVAWTVMLKAYADKEGYKSETMHLFVEMLHDNVTPNCYTLSIMLSNATLELGEQLHACIVKWSLDSDAFVGSSLVDVYAKSGNLGLAQLVFDRIPLKDVVCYNCLISGYGRTGIIENLVSLYVEMYAVELVPNQSTFVGLLSGCAYSGCICLSKQFHAQVIVRGFFFYEVVQGAIIDMYAKCGDIEAARAAFDTATCKQNVAIWNSIICGYGKHGHTEEALKVFNLMESSSVYPDYITFICLLSACGHTGLVDEGLRLFCLMQHYSIPATEEHYSCMVDLFGRAGMVREAYELISKSRCKFGPSLWGALLCASRVHGDASIGEIAAERLFELEPECSGSYVALANIYAAEGQWGKANAIRELMNNKNIQKETGYSTIEVGGTVHKFRAGGGSD